MAGGQHGQYGKHGPQGQQGQHGQRGQRAHRGRHGQMDRRLSGRWPLVGRESELALFERALSEGTVRAMLVYGPPGVGKTRFAQECRDLAEDTGHVVARTAASRTAAAIPLGAVAHLLPSGLGGDQDPGTLVDRARQDLRELAGDSRMVLLVDDLPLLDQLSLGLLTQLALAGDLFLIATLRTGEQVPDALAALWSGDGAVRVDLADLDRPLTVRLLHEVLGGQVGVSALAGLWLAGRGNPLYLRELLLGAVQGGTLRREAGVWRLAGALPSSPRLLELVGERVRIADPTGRAVLDRLALCQPLGLDELAESAEVAVLEELESAGLIQVRTARRRHEVTLTHPVYAQVLQEAMARIRIRRVLLDQVERVEANGTRRREDTLRVATWRLDATGTADPVLLLRACRLARHSHGHGDLERLARSALAAQDEPEARLLLADALIARCRFAEAEEILQGALALASPDDDLRRQLVMLRAVNLQWGLGRPDLASAWFDRGRAELPARHHRELTALQSLYLALEGRSERALELLAGIELGADEARSRLHLLAETLSLATVGRGGQAIALLTAEGRPWERDDPQGRFLHVGTQCMVEALVHQEAGLLPAAITAMTRALDHAVEDDLAQSLGTCAWQLGMLTLATGRPRTAARWARDGMAVARANDLPVLLSLAAACLATSLATLGDAEGARDALADVDPALPASAGMAARARAWTAAAGGELSAGRETLLACAGEAEARGLRVAAAELLHDVARLGQPGRVTDRLHALAADCDSPLVRAYADHARGAARTDPALLERTADRFMELRTPLFAAEAMTTAAALWRGLGDQRRAAAAQARAGESLAGCEGARTPAVAHAAEGLAPLTQREREICLLAAGGSTSRQIADRLVLSVRTVNNHLQNAYTKLGVGGRGELATALRTARTA